MSYYACKYCLVGKLNSLSLLYSLVELKEVIFLSDLSKVIIFCGKWLLCSSDISIHQVNFCTGDIAQ